MMNKTAVTKVSLTPTVTHGLVPTAVLGISTIQNHPTPSQPARKKEVKEITSASVTDLHPSLLFMGGGVLLLGGAGALFLKNRQRSSDSLE